MTSKFLRRGTAVVALVLVLGLLVRSHYVLDSQKLDAATKSELPPGTLKARVIEFIQQRKPQFCDDLGTHVKARITGRAGNLIYRKDIVLDFEFDAGGRLLSFSNKEYLTFV
jgi:hypothetical protein